MERNWLIRTTQDQILGPVAKAKVVEFLEKGALGLNDEVTSGNGYWFSLKEKDLVGKYLYGDIPQGYNPISESKSVLSKRENPDKTTSLNNAPANKTQVLRATSTTNPGIIPPKEDLEYPDITVVNQKINLGNLNTGEELKLPKNEDLEFPDITLIKASINENPHAVNATTAHPSGGHSRPAAVAAPANLSDEPVVYPDDDDLAFPDMISGSSAGTASHGGLAVVEEEREFKVPIKKSAEEFNNEFSDDSGLSLDKIHHEVESSPEKTPAPVVAPAPAPKVEKVEPAPSLGLVGKKDKLAQGVPHAQHALYERKIKTSMQQPPKDHANDLPEKEVASRSMPEDLKKRNDNYLLYVLVILVLIILSLFFYYYRTILNKPLPV